jgi:hypothetical protein
MNGVVSGDRGGPEGGLVVDSPTELTPTVGAVVATTSASFPSAQPSRVRRRATTTTPRRARRRAWRGAVRCAVAASRQVSAMGKGCS